MASRKVKSITPSSERISIPNLVPKMVLRYYQNMDNLSVERRSQNMARIKSVGTKPEKTVRSLLYALGFRFRVNRNDLPGKPDIVLPKYKTVIFVHGCFWHSHRGCKRSNMPTSNVEYWQKKLSKNKQRDINTQDILKKSGWNVVIVWECEIRNLENLKINLPAKIRRDDTVNLKTEDSYANCT